MKERGRQSGTACAAPIGGVDTEMGKWAEVDDDDGVEHEMELRGHGRYTHD